MNKQELIAKIVKDTGASKALVGKVLDSAIDGIKKTLKKGDTIRAIRITRVGQAAREFKTDDDGFKKLMGTKR